MIKVEQDVNNKYKNFINFYSTLPITAYLLKRRFWQFFTLEKCTVTLTIIVTKSGVVAQARSCRG